MLVFFSYLLSDKAQGMMQTLSLCFQFCPDFKQHTNDPYVVKCTGANGCDELDQQLLVGRDYAKAKKRFIRNWKCALGNQRGRLAR